MQSQVFQQQPQPQQHQQQPAPAHLLRAVPAPPPLVTPRYAYAYPSASNTALVPFEPSYLERMWQRRRDMAKLGVLVMVVLLAISAHATIMHYVRVFLEEGAGAEWSPSQQAALRIAYPLLVLLLLWHTKMCLGR